MPIRSNKQIIQADYSLASWSPATTCTSPSWHDLDLRGSPDERHACRRTPQQCPEWSNETELLPKSGVQIASNCQLNTSQKNGTDSHQPRFPSLNLLLWSLQNPLSSPQLDTPAISPKLWKPPNWAWPHWKRQIGRKRNEIVLLPSGYVKIAIENGHRNSGFTH